MTGLIRSPLRSSGNTDRFQAKATFFVTGKSAAAYPDWWGIIDAGTCGTHGVSASSMRTYSQRAVERRSNWR
jgi:hypothetical protein